MNQNRQLTLTYYIYGVAGNQIRYLGFVLTYFYRVPVVFCFIYSLKIDNGTFKNI